MGKKLIAAVVGFTLLTSSIQPWQKISSEYEETKSINGIVSNKDLSGITFGGAGVEFRVEGNKEIDDRFKEVNLGASVLIKYKEGYITISEYTNLRVKNELGKKQTYCEFINAWPKNKKTY